MKKELKKFVVLGVVFLLLAGGYVFSNYNQEKEKERKMHLGEFPDEILDCNNFCTKVAQNNCRIEDKIAYCLESFSEDLDENKQLANYNKGLYSVCEKKVYCPLEHSCTCDIELDMRTCLKLLENISIQYPEANIDMSYGNCSEPTESPKWTEFFNVPEEFQ